MSPTRSFTFATGKIYHVYNRGVDKRTVFESTKHYTRAVNCMKYYAYHKNTLSFSKFLGLATEHRRAHTALRNQDPIYSVEIVAYCLMPTHFHFVLRQLQEDGIPKFMANFSNSYTKYFNKLHDRSGALFQGRYKATIVRTEEQLLNLARYVHRNPLEAGITKPGTLINYKWSSLRHFAQVEAPKSTSVELILSKFKSNDLYLRHILT